MEVVCIKHPKYIGKSTPQLSCKSCCGIFIAEIKASQGDVDIKKWLDGKVKEAREYNVRK